MKLTVEILGRNDTVIEAREGWTVMEAIRDAGLPVLAQCGGGKACATCHVHVAPAYFERFPSPDEDERDLLEASEVYDETQSRLSCQLVLSDALDGLSVVLQPDSTDI
ncbi:2Fe-2S iron-sulfur cluster-binding protein [Sphingobium xenophagum]|uniref:2Fe-2S iron-sulfur cluster-binding protein n=1 Tax=Sphingobium xenophagum TaxID=121428 RepID=UPI001C0AA57D|nr:2Fe-2S iron-sulfur cluster-binding protein [Sphingobium xenophagum]QWT16626.1 2Fe-2S iron-sulfur cluster binding domain-containing protein [Sphingobium xenophagum]